MAFSDLEILGMAYGYTDETVLGGGAIKGKNCTIKSITPITGGNRVTFEWTLDDGTVETQTMDVMDGQAPAGEYVDKDQFDDNFATVAGGNLLELADGTLKAGNVVATIKNNVITFNGTVASNKFLYIKLSNTLSMVEATGAKQVPDAWAAESVSIMTSGKKYGFKLVTLGGTLQATTAAPSMALKDSGKNTIQTEGALFTYDGSGAYLQLYLGKEAVLNNFQVACMVTEDHVPAQYVSQSIALEAYDPLWKKFISRVANEENFLSIPNTSYETGLGIYTQGMCVAEGYLFVTLRTNTPHLWLNKYDVSDGTLIDSVSMDELGHGNDITYNPIDGLLYIIDLDNPNVIHKVTTDLEYVSSVTVNLSGVYAGYTGVGAIDFNVDRNAFVCTLRGTNKGYAIFDPKFVLQDIVWTRFDGGTYGGIATDADFIYQVAASPNEIYVYGFNGKYIGRLRDLGKLSVSDGSRWEIESMAITDNVLYVAYNSLSNANTTYVDTFDITEKIYGFLPRI